MILQTRMKEKKKKTVPQTNEKNFSKPSSTAEV